MSATRSSARAANKQIHKPYVTARIAIDFGKVTKATKNKVIKALKRGYANTRSGVTKDLYSALCSHFGLPVNQAYCPSWYGDGLVSTAYAHCSRAPTELFEACEAKWPAEVTAHKMLHGDKKYHQGKHHIRGNSAYWHFSATGHDDTLFEGLVNADWYKERVSAALAVIESGELVLREA